MRNKTKLLFVFCALILLTCSTNSRYKVLSFLFDGVDDSDTGQFSESDSTEMDSVRFAELTDSATGIQRIVFHAVYEQKECESCHNSEEGYALVESIPDLCYQCHEEFSESYEYLHVPVEAGECTECHHPHFTRIQKLLIDAGQQLCFNCHDQEEFQESDVHSEIGETNCIECHNPHGGEDETLLN